MFRPSQVPLTETPEAQAASASIFPDPGFDPSVMRASRTRLSAQDSAIKLAGPDTYAARPAYGVDPRLGRRARAPPRAATRPASQATSVGLARPPPPDVALSVDEIPTTASAQGGPLEQTVTRLSAPRLGGPRGDATLARAIASPVSIARAPARPEQESVREGPPPKRPALSRPAAVPTEIPTTTVPGTGEAEAPQPGVGRATSSVVGRAAGLFGSLAPDIAMAATAKGEQGRRVADTNLAVNVGSQVVGAALPGAGALAGDIAGLASGTRAQRGARPTPASALKTAADAADLVQSRMSQAAAPAAVQPPAAPQAAPPPPAATPPPAPTSEGMPSSAGDIPAAGSEIPGAGEASGERAAVGAGEKVAEEAGEKAASKAGEAAAGEAVGEAVGETALDAIPGVGEIAAGVLGLVSIFAATRKPRNLPPPPPATAQAFQAGL